MRQSILFLIFFITLLSIQPAFSAPKNSLKADLTHMLNRLSFGPRPEELNILAAQGKNSKKKWIGEQLNPEKIDDSILDEKIRHIKSLDMESKDIINFYKKPEDLAKELGIAIEATDTNDDIRKKVKDSIGSDRFPDALINELQSQKIIRAIESKKQLQEVLVDFWFNHFNVDAGKNDIKFVIYNYENEVIRKNVFKSFPEMLLASAHHPAMEDYLDNRSSRKGAVNENYAREVMELHSLGVDGGYTQKDVQELARILTGWSVKDIKEDPKFFFNEKNHDKSEKNWLGEIFPAKIGELEGEHALNILALHPKTAKHICDKLVAYFVDDIPPATLTTKCVDKFLRTKGNFKEIYSVIFQSAEFWNPKYHQTKIKKPFQLITSSMRALGGEVLSSVDLQKSSKSMGEELYRSASPVGYKTDTGTWVNSGSMMARLQYALDLSSHKFSGVLVQWPVIDKKQNTDQQIISMAQSLGISPLSESSRKIIKHELELELPFFVDHELRLSYIGKMSGMILGSPDFQRK